MKKLKRNKKKKALNAFLFKNYLVISGLLFCVLFLAILVTDFFVDSILFNGISMEDIQIEDIYSYPYETIDTEILDAYGGWIEILDEEKNVIFVKGDKQDHIYHYTDQMLYQKMNVMMNNDSMIYHVYEVSDPNQKNHLFLWKQPQNSTNQSIQLFVLFIIVFSALLLIALYFYSLFSVKQIKRPLVKIISGIKEMESHNYKVRLDFTAEKEIAEIRDAFNKMATKIEESDSEKKKMEDAKKLLLLHLSHDLKTPITSIYGFSKLLYDEKIEVNDQKRYLKYIHDKSDYLAVLINDLFELAKLDGKDSELNRNTVNLTEWLRQIIIELYPEIEDKGIHLDVTIPQEKIKINIDALKMKRVITNIMNNAIKYNEQGMTIYVECYKKNNEAIIIIGDNGVGIDSNIKDNIFDDFIRGFHEDRDGSGLGLAISKKIVDLHEGNILLEEDEKYQTKFKIILPLHEEL